MEEQIHALKVHSNYTNKHPSARWCFMSRVRTLNKAFILNNNLIEGPYSLPKVMVLGMALGDWKFCGQLSMW
jgi:hypothetical protein